MARTLGELQLLVMLAILRLGDGAYAVSIADEIQRVASRRVGRATIYVTIRRLEEQGLVSTWMGDPLPERGGKRRRYARVEAAGQAALAEARAAIERMASDAHALEPGA